MQTLDLLGIQQCDIWIKTIREEEDLFSITRDLRGNYKRNLFYELYPLLEQEAKSYAMDLLASKKSNFKVKDLAVFVNERFNQLYGSSIENIEDSSQDKNQLIRSEESIRCDLIRWGAKYDSNKKRPYFEGHEREDVVKSRSEFCNYFIKNKSLYFTIKRNETEFNWVIFIFFFRILCLSFLIFLCPR